MKYKKGATIMSLDDLAGELRKLKPIYKGDNYLSPSHPDVFLLDTFSEIINNIENRNFFYAVEDENKM